MAKKNRSDEETVTAGRFQLSKTKIGKPTMIMVTFQLTELQEAHLNSVAKGAGTSRAELCKQAVAFVLEDMGQPLPQDGQADEELQEALEARRAARAERAERRQANQSDD